MGTSILDGKSLIGSFIDPLQARYGLVEGSGGAGRRRGAGGGGGGHDDREEAGGEEEEEEEAVEELSARDQVIKGLVAGAGKLGERPPAPPPPAAKKGVFGGLFGGKK